MKININPWYKDKGMLIPWYPTWLRTYRKYRG